MIEDYHPQSYPTDFNDVSKLREIAEKILTAESQENNVSGLIPDDIILLTFGC